MRRSTPPPCSSERRHSCLQPPSLRPASRPALSSLLSLPLEPSRPARPRPQDTKRLTSLSRPWLLQPQRWVCRRPMPSSSSMGKMCSSGSPPGTVPFSADWEVQQDQPERVDATRGCIAELPSWPEWRRPRRPTAAHLSHRRGRWHRHARVHCCGWSNHGRDRLVDLGVLGLGLAGLGG